MQPGYSAYSVYKSFFLFLDIPKVPKRIQEASLRQAPDFRGSRLRSTSMKMLIFARPMPGWLVKELAKTNLTSTESSYQAATAQHSQFSWQLFTLPQSPVLEEPDRFSAVFVAAWQPSLSGMV